MSEPPLPVGAKGQPISARRTSITDSRDRRLHIAELEADSQPERHDRRAGRDDWRPHKHERLFGILLERRGGPLTDEKGRSHSASGLSAQVGSCAGARIECISAPARDEPSVFAEGTIFSLIADLSEKKRDTLGGRLQRRVSESTTPGRRPRAHPLRVSSLRVSISGDVP